MIVGIKTNGDDGKKVENNLVEKWNWDVAVQDVDLESKTITLNYNIENNEYYMAHAMAPLEFVDSLTWNETEEFDYSDKNYDIVVIIPCGYTIEDTSYDFRLRIVISGNSIVSDLIGW